MRRILPWFLYRLFFFMSLYVLVMCMIEQKFSLPVWESIIFFLSLIIVLLFNIIWRYNQIVLNLMRPKPENARAAIHYEMLLKQFFR